MSRLALARSVRSVATARSSVARRCASSKAKVVESQKVAAAEDGQLLHYRLFGKKLHLAALVGVSTCVLMTARLGADMVFGRNIRE